jgi:hypothetical protein
MKSELDKYAQKLIMEINGYDKEEVIHSFDFLLRFRKEDRRPDKIAWNKCSPERRLWIMMGCRMLTPKLMSEDFWVSWDKSQINEIIESRLDQIAVSSSAEEEYDCRFHYGLSQREIKEKVTKIPKLVVESRNSFNTSHNALALFTELCIKMKYDDILNRLMAKYINVGATHCIELIVIYKPQLLNEHKEAVLNNKELLVINAFYLGHVKVLQFIWGVCPESQRWPMIKAGCYEMVFHGEDNAQKWLINTCITSKNDFMIKRLILLYKRFEYVKEKYVVYDKTTQLYSLYTEDNTATVSLYDILEFILIENLEQMLPMLWKEALSIQSASDPYCDQSLDFIRSNFRQLESLAEGNGKTVLRECFAQLEILFFKLDFLKRIDSFEETWELLSDGLKKKFLQFDKFSKLFLQCLHKGKYDQLLWMWGHCEDKKQVIQSVYQDYFRGLLVGGMIPKETKTMRWFVSEVEKNIEVGCLWKYVKELGNEFESIKFIFSLVSAQTRDAMVIGFIHDEVGEKGYVDLSQLSYAISQVSDNAKGPLLKEVINQDLFSQKNMMLGSDDIKSFLTLLIESNLVNHIAAWVRCIVLSYDDLQYVCSQVPEKARKEILINTINKIQKSNSEGNTHTYTKDDLPGLTWYINQMKENGLQNLITAWFLHPIQVEVHIDDYNFNSRGNQVTFFRTGATSYRFSSRLDFIMSSKDVNVLDWCWENYLKDEGQLIESKFHGWISSKSLSGHVSADQLKWYFKHLKLEMLIQEKYFIECLGEAKCWDIYENGYNHFKPDIEKVKLYFECLFNSILEKTDNTETHKKSLGEHLTRAFTMMPSIMDFFEEKGFFGFSDFIINIGAKGALDNKEFRLTTEGYHFFVCWLTHYTVNDVNDLKLICSWINAYQDKDYKSTLLSMLKCAIPVSLLHISPAESKEEIIAKVQFRIVLDELLKTVKLVEGGRNSIFKTDEADAVQEGDVEPCSSPTRELCG